MRTRRCDFTGADCDEDGVYQIVVTKRNMTGELLKLELDGQDAFVNENILQKVAKKPLAWQVWKRHDKEEQAKTGKTGHWEKRS